PCRCGNRGCLEVYASNSAAVRYYTQSSASRSSKPGARTPTFDDVLRLAEQDDPKALEAIDQVAHYLGRGIAIIVTGLAPDVIVVVGELTRFWDRVGPVISSIVKSRSSIHAPTKILPTDPATHPRLRGTIALVLQKYFGAPSVA
ncbi:MAG: ROK family protein, partial [Blastocatellia bacterium]|nr:ROK family protein [Blastocatellia bacterium]